MRYLINTLVVFVFFNSVYCQSLTDHNATPQTRRLYHNLQRLALKGVMFGQQDIMSSGVNWQNEPGRSDIKEVCGEYPAVFGWDIGKLELGSSVDFDYVPFNKIPGYIMDAYKMGGVNTICWHVNNPVDPAEGVRFKTIDSTINKMFADTVILNRYRTWLDKVADFMLNLKGSKGELIPVIFRPFHEHTGNWFWWGKSHCTPAEFVQLWRFTVNYLRDTRHVHNLIYAYSTDRFNSREDYLERYPGDDYVDMLGFDYYDKPENYPGNKFAKDARRMVEILGALGKEKRKLYALTEFGIKLVPLPNWWTQTLLPIIQHSGLSYALAWRNGSKTSYWGTFPGQISAADFIDFYHSPQLLFQKQVAKEKLYK